MTDHPIALVGGEATPVFLVDPTTREPYAPSGGSGGGGGEAETLWTDDTGAYFIRVNTNGVITWTDITGAASAAPGTGAKPASGTASSNTTGSGATDAGTLRVVTATDDPTIPILEAIESAAQSTATVATSADFTTVFEGATPYTVKRALFNTSTVDTTIATPAAGKRIIVFSLFINAAAAVNAKFQDGTAGTDISGTYFMASAGAGNVHPDNQKGWFETVTPGDALNLHLSAAVNVSGEVVYAEIT